MNSVKERGIAGLGVLLLLITSAAAQEAVILTGDELTKVVPPGFYFEGQVGPTQMRNAAAVRLEPKRNIVAALVDTSGYASTIRGKYEGFIICDKAITVGDAKLAAGAYGFGFTEGGELNIFDVGGTRLHSVRTTRDENLKTPRPLAMVKAAGVIRLYRGRAYVDLK
jgi:hypothetical protein